MNHHDLWSSTFLETLCSSGFFQGNVLDNSCNTQTGYWYQYKPADQHVLVHVYVLSYCCCVCAVMKVQIQLDCEDSHASFYDLTLPSFHNLLKHFITYFFHHLTKLPARSNLGKEGLFWPMFWDCSSWSWKSGDRSRSLWLLLLTPSQDQENRWFWAGTQLAFLSPLLI